MVCSKDIFTPSPYMHADRVGAVGGIVAQKSLKAPHEGLLQKSLYPKKKSLKIPAVWFKSPISPRDFNKSPSNQTGPYILPRSAKTLHLAFKFRSIKTVCLDYK